ncbi:MAG: hypothetical protein ACLFU8_03430 [Anaerolineales bacterium]
MSTFDRHPEPEEPGHVERQNRTEFPLGDSRIRDRDVQSFEDLERHYPLPAGYRYRREAGVPYVVRESDGALFTFTIEGNQLTFTESYTDEAREHAERAVQVLKRP